MSRFLQAVGALTGLALDATGGDLFNCRATWSERVCLGVRSPQPVVTMSSTGWA
jgi:hypothetical protein